MLKKTSVIIAILAFLLAACAPTPTTTPQQTSVPSVAQQPVIAQSIPTLSESGWKQWRYNAQYRRADGSDGKIAKTNEWIRDNITLPYCRQFEYVGQIVYVLIPETCEILQGSIQSADPPPTLVPIGGTPAAQVLEPEFWAWGFSGEYRKEGCPGCESVPVQGRGMSAAKEKPEPICSAAVYFGVERYPVVDGTCKTGDPQWFRESEAISRFPVKVGK